MRYVVLCAVPDGPEPHVPDPSTGLSYTWPGQLGTGAGLGAGAPATVAEQQVVSACLAAHANKYGLHVNLSVLGPDAHGQRIPYTA